jgi:YD repeat-containing protein
MLRPSIFVLAAACGGSTVKPSSHAPLAPTPPPAPAYCPQLPLGIVGYWASELFPACQDGPFEILTLCKGQPCPKPCARTLESSLAPGPVKWTVHYGSDGPWNRMTSDDGTPEVACTFANGKRESCTMRGKSWRVVRDAQGLITALVIDQTRSEVRRDSQGRTIAIGDAPVTYDQLGRLAGVKVTRFEWGSKGRVVRERSPEHESTLTYDDEGRLVRIKHEALVQDETIPPVVVSIEYDEARVRSTRQDGGGMFASATFDYCD